METLSPGSLLKLLEEKETPSHEAKPVLLQIRSIVPVLSDSKNDDLWPKQGFRLKVADSSHAMYVSLPQELNDMVLLDELGLGQLILADKLERDDLSLSPPVLRGIKPVSGRHACLGDPQDLDFSESFSSPMSLSCSSKRRSWVIGEKGVSKMNSRRKSFCVCTSRIEENGNLSSKKKAHKWIENSDKGVTQKTSKFMKNLEDSFGQAVALSSPLPSDLAKLGKEVEKCRDLALLASVDALQEASVAEKLLKCIKTFLEIKSSNSKLQDKEKYPSTTSSLNKLFNLQQDLSQTRLILKSLKNTKSLVTPNDTVQNCHESALKVAEDRKKGASSWITAALASDLVPLPSPSPRREANNAAKRQPRTENKDASSMLGKKRNGLCACIGIASALNEECEKWFLGYAEKYFDGLLKSKKVDSLECLDSEVAQIMCQIKKVSDWLEEKEKCGLMVEACGRLRKKIYGVLLKMADRTALALGTL